MIMAMMTGHTFNHGNMLTLFVFIVVKIFTVDLLCHLHHFAGYSFFRFGITGEIQVMAGGIGRRCMTKSAFYPRGCLKAIHHFVKVLFADIFRKYFQVFKLNILGRLGSGDTQPAIVYPDFHAFDEMTPGFACQRAVFHPTCIC
jgi:hypothetical protein